MKSIVFKVLFIAGCIVVGILSAFLTAHVNQMKVGLYVWPFAACVSVFLFSSIGFFLTQEKKEVLYGACSIASLACGIVQLAILF